MHQDRELIRKVATIVRSLFELNGPDGHTVILDQTGDDQNPVLALFPIKGRPENFSPDMVKKGHRYCLFDIPPEAERQTEDIVGIAYEFGKKDMSVRPDSEQYWFKRNVTNPQEVAVHIYDYLAMDYIDENEYHKTLQ